MNYINDLIQNESMKYKLPEENDGYSINDFNSNTSIFANKINHYMAHPNKVWGIDTISSDNSISFGMPADIPSMIFDEGSVIIFEPTRNISMRITSPVKPLVIDYYGVRYPVFKDGNKLMGDQSFFFQENTLYFCYLEKYTENSEETYRWNLFELSTWKRNVMHAVAWADGTDEEIAIMLHAHYKGDIDIHEFWAYGDEREEHLIDEYSGYNSRCIVSGLFDPIITLVLMDDRGMPLKYPIHGVNQSAFIVGQKNQLAKGDFAYQSNNWKDSEIRQFLNSEYSYPFPSVFKSIFKQFKYSTATSYDSTNGQVSETLSDYFVLPSETEVFGSSFNFSETITIDGVSKTFNFIPTVTEGQQIQYYTTYTNRIKKNNTNSIEWWLRTQCFEEPGYIKITKDNGDMSIAPKNSSIGIGLGIAPIGCI